MNEKLNDLLAKYNETKEITDSKQETINNLEQQVKEKQDAIISKMRKDLQAFSKYIIHGNDPYVTLDIKSNVLSFYNQFQVPGLQIRFQKDSSNIEIFACPAGYSSPSILYDLKNDRWGWYDNRSKKAITENYDKVYVAIEEAVVKHIESRTNSLNENTANKINSLSSSLEKMEVVPTSKTDVHQNKDQSTLLYKAISLLIDETFEQYDDSREWLDMIEKELGFTTEEMKEFGIHITIDGGIYSEYEEKSVKVVKDSFKDMLKSAKQCKPSSITTQREDKDNREY